MEQHVHDMMIVGGGPGGYTAALYAARAGLDVVLFEKMAAGGQMALTSQIDNYPGFPEGVDGFQLGQDMRKGAQRFGAKTVSAEVLSTELSGPVRKVQTKKAEYLGRTVVFSTGADPRKLGLENEWALTGKGVHYCAHCDGMFYRGKTVVVVGGGNSAAADALYLSRLCKKVIVVHRRDTLRATKVYHEPLMQAENVEFCWNSEVAELLQEETLTGVKLRSVLTGDAFALSCDGVFISIGRQPATALVEGQLELDESGYIRAGESTETNIPGVYAVGDVRTKALRQIVTATADGAVAAHYAEQYLSEK